jgi:hypothetical protein
MAYLQPPGVTGGLSKGGAYGSATSTYGTNLDRALALASKQLAEAAGIKESLDAVYLGDKISDPTLDNAGDALRVGALYFNTTTQEIRVYTAEGWVAVASSQALNIYTFNGDGTTTGFILPAAPFAKTNVQVFYQGVHQAQATFTLTDSLVSLSFAPIVGVGNIEIQVLNYVDTGGLQTLLNEAIAASNAATTAAAAIAGDALLASTSASSATASALSATASASAASADAITASADAITATTKAGEALASANSASADAITATSSASTATTKAGEASVSAAAALVSELAAAASADSISGGPVTSVNGLTGIVVISPGLAKKEEPTATVTGLVDRRHHLNAAATTVTAPASADGAKFGVNPMGQTDCFINWGAASLITPGGTFTGIFPLNLGLSEDYEFSSTSNVWSSI